MEERGKPYEIAIVAYALLVAKASTAEQAYNILAKHEQIEDEYRYWGREYVPLPPTKQENQKTFRLPRLPFNYDSENIETTSYALLVYVARQELMLEPIVRWLNVQRLTDGGWASTQDTVWAMKALMEYTVRSRIRDVSSLSVNIEFSSVINKTETLTVNHKNLARLQTIEVCNILITVHLML